jgi:hypothetical protein
MSPGSAHIAPDGGAADQPEDLIDPVPGKTGRRRDDPQVLGGTASRVEAVIVQGGPHLAYWVGQLMVGQAADDRRPIPHLAVAKP